MGPRFITSTWEFEGGEWIEQPGRGFEVVDITEDGPVVQFGGGDEALQVSWAFVEVTATGLEPEE